MTEPRIDKCPQCSASVIQPREGGDYCEECGWPDENWAPNTDMPESIKTGRFLLIGRGESYSGEIVDGTKLLDKMLELLYGTPQDASQEERDDCAADLADMDNWHSDGDYGPTQFSRDVGETDHIDIFRITEPSPVHVQ